MELTFGIRLADGSAALTGGRPGPEFMAQWKMHAQGASPRHPTGHC